MDEKAVYKRTKSIQNAKGIYPEDLELALITHYHSLREPLHGDAISIAERFFNLAEEPTVDAIYSAVQTNLFGSTYVPFKSPDKGHELFTFIDLFAGIGGFRMALQNLGGRCVFTSEWDKFSKQTYFANYGEYPFGDITKEDVKQYIPEKFDLLCGGFPCQPFSLAGVSKKNSLGRSHGFDDEKQGNLFFHIVEILQKHRPKAFLLENVKNLVSHDKGNTFKVIKNHLLDLGYSFDSRVIDAKYFVPQHRERTLMVGFDKSVYGSEIKFDFNTLNLPNANHELRSILEKDPDPKFTLSDKLWNYLQDYAKKHKEKGNGFGFGLANLNGISRTMSARYHKDGAEILIPQPTGNPRRLTPREAAYLLGYPKEFIIPVSDTQAYRQFGNSVVVPLIQALGEQVIKVMKDA